MGVRCFGGLSLIGTCGAHRQELRIVTLLFSGHLKMRHVLRNARVLQRKSGILAKTCVQSYGHATF